MVLVVDSVNFPQEVRDIAHLTISVLSDPLVQRRRVPVLVTCNKQGLGPLVSSKHSIFFSQKLFYDDMLGMRI